MLFNMVDQKNHLREMYDNFLSARPAMYDYYYYYDLRWYFNCRKAMP